MDSDRIYRHFCMMARALDEVGERWSLLIVRDLLLGPRRFTDLTTSLGGITPTRLTDRLRSLDAAGIVVREPATVGREVWYRLTEAGGDLGTVVEALALWGLEHRFEPPRSGEPVHPDHVMLATRVWLTRRGARAAAPVAWVWRFSADQDYTVRFGADTWELSRGQMEPATVTVVATPEAWARFLTAGPEARQLPRDDIQLVGAPAATEALAQAFDADLDSA
jgi:DNA-binding HxlR family transcriptional regulator